MTISSWMKITGCILIVTGTSGYGFWMAARYGERLKMLEQLRQMIFLLKGQIIYANAPLEEAFEAVGNRTEGALSELFYRVAGRIREQQGEPFVQIWKEEIDGLGPEALTQKDRLALAGMGEHLGFMDRDMQERNLLLFLEQLDLEIQGLRAHKQERTRLYTSLGVMGGLFLAILLS